MNPSQRVLAILCMATTASLSAEETLELQADHEIQAAIDFHQGMLNAVRESKAVINTALVSHLKAQLKAERDVLKNGLLAEKLVLAIAGLDRKINMAENLLEHKDGLDPRFSVNEAKMREGLKEYQVKRAAFRQELDARRKASSPERKPGNGKNHGTR